MRLRIALVAVLALACHCIHAQPAKRLAIIKANGPLAQVNNLFALGEDRVTESLTAKLAGTPGFTIIDRASIEKILKEQNFQNSDRSSPNTAVQIGKILGAGQIVLVQLVEASQSTHQETSATAIKNIGTVVLKVSARTIDVEGGVILTQPSSSFEDSVVLSEVNLFTHKTKGGDPQVLMSNLWTKATESVTAELATKLTEALAQAPAPKEGSPLVAGIANGSVFINQGTTSGIKNGDRFQVVRMASLGLKDPATGQDLKQKQRICLFVVVNADENNSSGTCEGKTPQSGDVTEPMHP